VNLGSDSQSGSNHAKKSAIRLRITGTIFALARSYVPSHRPAHPNSIDPRWYVRVKHKTPSHPFVHPSIPFTEIGAPLLPIIDRPILLLGDNDVATKTALGTVSSAKTKHWDLYEHMNKQRYELGVTLPDRVPSPDNNTDCGTKSQKTADFLRLYRRLKGYSESYIPPNYNLKHGPMGNAAD